MVVFVLGLSMTGCVTVLEKQVSSNQERAQIHVLLALDYLRYNQFDVARSELDMAFNIDNSLDTLYHAKGLLFERSGHPLEAAEMFRKSIKLNPLNFTAINDYAVHLCQRNSEQTSEKISGEKVAGGKKAETILTDQNKNGTFDGALQIAEFQEDGFQEDELTALGLLETIQDHPDNDQLFQTDLALGVCNQKLGRMDVAASFFRKVLEKHAYLPQALLPMAEISYENRQFLGARGFIERYFSTGSVSSRSLFLATMIEIELDDEHSSKRYYRELTNKFPDTREAKKASSVLNLI